MRACFTSRIMAKRMPGALVSPVIARQGAIGKLAPGVPIYRSKTSLSLQDFGARAKQ